MTFKTQTGLEGKFSIYTAAALAIVAGAAGPKQFTDDLVQRADVVALRNRVVATVTPGISEAQLRVAMTTKDGRRRPAGSAGTATAEALSRGRSAPARVESRDWRARVSRLFLQRST